MTFKPFQTSMKIYTILIFTVAAFLSLSCEKKQEQTASVPKATVVKAQPAQKKAPVQKEDTFKSCEELIAALVKSSNVSALKTFKDVKIRIEEVTSEKITVELYVTNNISEDSSVKMMADHAVGWLEFFPAAKKLQDITFDPEEPEILKYDHSLIGKTEITKLCSFEEKQ